MNWIEISEGQPEEDQDIIVVGFGNFPTDYYFEIGNAELHFNVWYCVDDGRRVKIQLWCPLKELMDTLPNCKVKT